MPAVRRQISGNGPLTLASLGSLDGGLLISVPTAFAMNNTIGLTPNGGGVIPLAAGNTGLYAGTGKVLHIRATGLVSGEETLTLTLYQIPASVVAAGLSATSFTNWNKVAQSSAIVLNEDNDATLGSGWSFDARLQFGTSTIFPPQGGALTGSGNLVGQFTDAIDGGTVDEWQATTTLSGSSISGGAGNGNESDLNFVMVVTPGEGGLSFVSMTEFAINLED